METRHFLSSFCVCTCHYKPLLLDRKVINKLGSGLPVLLGVSTSPFGGIYQSFWGYLPVLLGVSTSPLGVIYRSFGSDLPVLLGYLPVPQGAIYQSIRGGAIYQSFGGIYQPFGGIYQSLEGIYQPFGGIYQSLGVSTSPLGVSTTPLGVIYQPFRGIYHPLRRAIYQPFGGNDLRGLPLEMRWLLSISASNLSHAPVFSPGPYHVCCFVCTNYSMNTMSSSYCIVCIRCLSAWCHMNIQMSCNATQCHSEESTIYGDMSVKGLDWILLTQLRCDSHINLNI